MENLSNFNISDDADDEGLSQAEFDALISACEEAMLIQKGLSQSVPASERWND
jgi:hypothetical protein